MQRYYDRRAEVYDHSMGYDDPEMVRSLEPVIEALRQNLTDLNVLEIACGPGFWTQRVASAARHVLATDLNESVLTLARAKAIDPERVAFARADAFDLSSIDAEFTAAFAVDWLAHVPRSRMRAFLEGLHRKLAPGAHVAFCDQTPRPTSLTGTFDAEGNHLQQRTLPDGSSYRVIKHFFSEQEVQVMLAPYAADLSIDYFQPQRRVLICYRLAHTSGI